MIKKELGVNKLDWSNKLEIQKLVKFLKNLFTDFSEKEWISEYILSPNNSHSFISKHKEKIILSDLCQPESTFSLEEYLYYRVDKSRIIAGRNVLKEHKDILNKISKHFGIQPRIIVAV